jgi:hypothetical protein
MWSWFNIGIFFFLMLIVLGIIAYVMSQSVMTDALNKKIEGELRDHSDIVILKSDEVIENKEEELDMGYVSDDE